MWGNFSCSLFLWLRGLQEWLRLLLRLQLRPRPRPRPQLQPQPQLRLRLQPLLQLVLALPTQPPQPALPLGVLPSLPLLSPLRLIFSSLSSWEICWGLQGQGLGAQAWLLPPSLWQCLEFPLFSRA